MKKICFVVQRYGIEVNGGAEYLCRLYAERMTQYYDVTVLTSCAIDHVTWKNEYNEGMEEINGVHVYRFHVDEERDLEQFCIEMSAYFGNPLRDGKDDLEWMKSNGPQCNDMYQYLLENRDNFEVYLFMGYLYYSTTVCMQTVADRAILISTAHDELPLNECAMFNAQFNLPAAFMFLTDEERDFVHHKFGNSHIPCVVTGSGITLPDTTNLDDQKDLFVNNNITGDYVVYVGRIEEGKSCDFLFKCFEKYKEIYGGELKLVLAGKSIMKIPDREDIVWLGFVSEEEKFAAIKNSRALVLASHQESLSLVVLEAMALGVPVLVNANCDVLKGHIDKSNAGLYFYEEEDFLLALKYLIENREENRRMGENGVRHITNHYTWDVIDQKMIDIIERIRVNVS